MNTADIKPPINEFKEIRMFRNTLAASLVLFAVLLSVAQAGRATPPDPKPPIPQTALVIVP